MQVAEYAKMGNFPRDPEIAKKDKENATKLAVTQMDKEMGTPAFKRKFFVAPYFKTHF